MSMTGDYANRSDLRNQANRRANFTGQTYGKSAAQQRAQDVVPAGAAPQDVAAQRMAGRVRPGARPLSRPTERPGEPVTAGAPFGPGVGPQGMSAPARLIPQNDLLDRLVALYNKFPNDRLRQVISNMTEQ